MANNNSYPVSLKVDYPKQLDRAKTFFRFILAIPILILVGALMGYDSSSYTTNNGVQFTDESGSIAAGLFAATALMIIFRQRYPKWWFNFNLELNRFTARVGAYLFLLTDKYPSTEDEQSVHLNFEYPDAKNDLNSLMPLVKWFLTIPHYVVLAFLMIGVIFATIIAWFSIIFTGKYPEGLFNYVVGVGRWSLRVSAYAFLLITDKYPPFSLSE